MCHGPCFLMEPMNPGLPGEGRWLTGDTSPRATEETGVSRDPVKARLYELLRRLASLDEDSSSNTDPTERTAARN